jgi:hypothetical protein
MKNTTVLSGNQEALVIFRDMKVFLYPMLEENGEIITQKLKSTSRMKELYKFFKFNGKVVDIDDYDPEICSFPA